MDNTVNGFPIVAGQFNFANSEGVVVCDLGDNGHAQRYVTWRIWWQGGKWCATAGHYTNDLDDAVSNMVTRS